jgi:hypothetical protein
MPADWFASLRPDSFDEHCLALARQQFFAAGADGKIVPAQVARLWGPKGLGGKIEIIRDHLLPSRETMALMYPAPVNSWRIYLNYLVRLKDVLVCHGATLWRLTHGDPKARAFAGQVNQITAQRDWLMAG